MGNLSALVSSCIGDGVALKNDHVSLGKEVLNMGLREFAYTGIGQQGHSCKGGGAYSCIFKEASAGDILEMGFLSVSWADYLG